MDKKTLYANIIIDISLEKLDRTFQYLIPEMLADQIHPGTPVEVPFGNGNRHMRGYVVEVTDQPEFDVSRMKSVLRVVREGDRACRLDAGKFRRDDESGIENSDSGKTEDNGEGKADDLAEARCRNSKSAAWRIAAQASDRACAADGSAAETVSTPL